MAVIELALDQSDDLAKLAIRRLDKLAEEKKRDKGLCLCETKVSIGNFHG